MSGTRSAWLCAAALTALTAALACTFTGGGTLGERGPLALWYPLDLALFALAVLALRRVPARRVPARRVAGLVLAGSVAVAATGLLAPPRTSDDAYRYLWDGQVQAAAISPYAYPPDAPQLAALRERAPALYPPSGSCTGWDLRVSAVGGFCSHVNRPGVPTIYPPVAEGWFLALHLAGPGHGVRTAQAGGALLAVATTGALLLALRRERRYRAALWGWFPGVAVWSVNDAHVDTLGALLMVAGLALAVRGRLAAGGGALGAAAAVKLIPALALPGALSGVLARRPTRRAPGPLFRILPGARRRASRLDAPQNHPSTAQYEGGSAARPAGRPTPRADPTRSEREALVLPLAALGVFALSYLPYVLLSGTGVLGFLPGYLEEEGYDQGQVQRFGLLRLLLPASVAAVAAVLVILAAVLYVLRRGDPARPWRGALLVTGTALLAVTPAYPWYGLLVVALVALDGRWEWLGVPAAGQVLYLLGGEAQQPAYAAALGLVLAGAALRVRTPALRTGRPRVGSRP